MDLEATVNPHQVSTEDLKAGTAGLKPDMAVLKEDMDLMADLKRGMVDLRADLKAGMADALRASSRVIRHSKEAIHLVHRGTRMLTARCRSHSGLHTVRIDHEQILAEFYCCSDPARRFSM